ncbi:DUF4214 domain-containing protein [Marivita geojedonensis]|uniref:DUF4214 domain-containing protein n=2 Tax=Marivita geojedonensis TaxID=1123756 RepID=A0A1X4NQD7_9RHOB|nr:DUF4214 domain-containing protein [Marivita geojedonensis]OSQ53153.1 hypothetical protein MGEO_00895 [Marivita geojedonensis]PRY81909.1 uncharacterized protein DUF4214 [Marivita geojedonensis]
MFNDLTEVRLMEQEVSYNNTPKGPVTILGIAYVGETLIARPNGIGDADGIDYSTATFQWLRDGQEIVGATSATYEVTSEDVGTQISIRYSYVDFGGTLEILTSDPEPAVPVEGTPLPDDSAPYNPLIVLGDAEVGETLTARPNAVTDPNGIDQSTVTYKWLRDGEPISWATNQQYTVTEADIDAEISVVYSYLDLLGNSKSLTSNPKLEVPVPSPDDQLVSDDAGENGDLDASVLMGTSGADTLTAISGLKEIVGLGGTDTAVFAGNQSEYSLILGKSAVSVSDHKLFGLGTILLDDVELIDFGTDLDVFGGPMNLEVFGGHTGLSRDALEDVVEVYIAYFNRAPDAIGLGFWGTAFAKGLSMEDMARLFSDQAETREAYPEGTSNLAFATTVYNNVLGRTPDDTGLSFWVDALESGSVSRDQFILKVLEGAKAELNMSAGYEFMMQQLADRAYLENKVDIGAYFAVHKGMSDVENAAEVMALYDGSQSSINSAVRAIEEHYQDALNPYDGEFLMQLVGVLDTPFAS